MQCQEVEKLIRTMPKGGNERTPRSLAEHLSECESCRRLHAGMQRLEGMLASSKVWLDEVARCFPLRDKRVLTEQPAPSKSRLRRLIPVWAGVAALILVTAGAPFLLLREEDIKAPDDLGTPMTTEAAATSSQILEELAEVLCRHKSPSLELPYSPAAFTYEPVFPQSFQQYTLEPEDTLGSIAESIINLTRRNET